MLRRIIPSSAFAYGTRGSQFRLLFSSSVKFQELSARQERERQELLEKIYLPLYGTRKMPGWIELLESGKLWEDYFHPFRWTSRDYEGNTLTVHDTQAIWEKLKKNNLDILLENRKLPLPGPRSLSDKPENEVIEIRNHLLSNYLVNTPKEKFEWEDEICYAGEFRKIGVMASHVHLTVYPYPQEVPALMKRFIEFCDESIKNDSLHPLILASRVFSSLNHVHPFVDGNGRVARSVMALYLIRNGYPPIVFQQMTSGSMAACLYTAQAGNDLTFLYNVVLQNVISILMRYRYQQ
ncbi:5394_t:CDS:2 [Paraglomus occultum]|uniref:5394_t:CDS:1 n=1 Tax=Paraglomus occultum TaxID=144539 RepID=A0A9N9CD01_9GLOM|nr:5394_t:CDS:2 [Paraglomus occultum]